jgi:hypothetical protein
MLPKLPTADFCVAEKGALFVFLTRVKSSTDHGLDIEAGGGVVVVARELRCQPDNTPHRNGTDHRALSLSVVGAATSARAESWRSVECSIPHNLAQISGIIQVGGIIKEQLRCLKLCTRCTLCALNA